MKNIIILLALLMPAAAMAEQPAKPLSAQSCTHGMSDTPGHYAIINNTCYDLRKVCISDDKVYSKGKRLDGQRCMPPDSALYEPPLEWLDDK